VFPPAPSLRLIKDTIVYTSREMPKWNPTNICSYHLQEAGATPVQELAFALAHAEAVLDEVKKSGEVSDAEFPQLFGRISFFVNAGVRFITEICKMRAFVDLWDEIGEKRYGVDDPALRRFRYGVQVNSLGLTEQQPENNPYRILLSMLAVTLSRKARARAVQLPAWNEALGLPRPFDQQWSLRLQQIVAYETDLLEYADIFDGSEAIDRKVEDLKEEARAELSRIQSMGGAVAAIDYMKEALIKSNAARVEAIEKGEQILVGVNAYTETEPSPLSASGGGILTVSEGTEIEQIANLNAWRQRRDDTAVSVALVALKSAATEGRNIMEPSIAAAKAGVTTGEWGQVLREVFGEYRAPTGIHVKREKDEARLEQVRKGVDELSEKLGRRLTFVVGKPGLDGHSNGAEQIAVRATDVGMEVVYDGIRLTPAEIVAQAKDANAHVLGLSILSGSHVALVRDVAQRMREAGMGEVPIVVGGIIPADDVNILKQCGASAIYTPKDFQLNDIMAGIVKLVDAKAQELASSSIPVPPLRAKEKVRL
jgi:(2R)-ethylmalonyl-CoA mutase